MKPSIADYKVNVPKLDPAGAWAVAFLLYLLDNCSYGGDYEVMYDHRYGRRDIAIVTLVDARGEDFPLEFTNISDLRIDLENMCRKYGYVHAPPSLVETVFNLFDQAYEDVFHQPYCRGSV